MTQRRGSSTAIASVPQTPLYFIVALLRSNSQLFTVSSLMRCIPRYTRPITVDALLEKIERDGEDQATLDGIIRLARKYKFVTPYTSFLSVPRALLRPRVIRPGDPIFRVKPTNPSLRSSTSVVALFPFGLVQPLRYLSAEDVW